jgi:hypothetical protein
MRLLQQQHAHAHGVHAGSMQQQPQAAALAKPLVKAAADSAPPKDKPRGRLKLFSNVDDAIAAYDSLTVDVHNADSTEPVPRPLTNFNKLQVGFGTCGHSQSLWPSVLSHHGRRVVAAHHTPHVWYSDSDA